LEPDELFRISEMYLTSDQNLERPATFFRIGKRGRNGVASPWSPTNARTAGRSARISLNSSDPREARIFHALKEPVQDPGWQTSSRSHADTSALRRHCPAARRPREVNENVPGVRRAWIARGEVPDERLLQISQSIVEKSRPARIFCRPSLPASLRFLNVVVGLGRTGWQRPLRYGGGAAE